jgi:hypothetical protein
VSRGAFFIGYAIPASDQEQPENPLSPLEEAGFLLSSEKIVVRAVIDIFLIKMQLISKKAL